MSDSIKTAKSFYVMCDVLTGVLGLVAVLCCSWDSYLMGRYDSGNKVLLFVGLSAVVGMIVFNSISLNRDKRHE